jgi:hypothetical protein
MEYDVFCCATCIGFTINKSNCWIAGHPICDIKTYPKEVQDRISDIRHNIEYHIRQYKKEEIK